MKQQLWQLTRIKEAINHYIGHGFKSQKELAEKMGYSEMYLSQVLNGRVPLSTKFVERLKRVCPDLNKEYLNGNNDWMFTTPDGADSETSSPSTQIRSHKVDDTEYIKVPVSRADVTETYINGQLTTINHMHDRLRRVKASIVLTKKYLESAQAEQTEKYLKEMRLSEMILEWCIDDLENVLRKEIPK